jgi:ATP-dependent Lon protease
VTKEDKKVSITPANLKDFLGVRRFKHGEINDTDEVGVVTGLAWTEVGGDILSLEALVLPGKGKIVTTGKLGDVMKESIEAAASLVRANAADYGIAPDMYAKSEVHVHVPEGATPKDGPSAGIGMVTCIVSALTGIAVRRDVAMTGEVTLRGRVLAIGGLKEKLLAAHAAGIKKVLIPIDNEKDLEEIPANIRENFEIVAVKHINEVLAHALVHPLVPLPPQSPLMADIPEIPDTTVADLVRPH